MADDRLARGAGHWRVRGAVLARAMVRDLYARERSAQMLSTLMTVMAIAPLLGPILGGQILVTWSWQGIFWTLVGFGLLGLAALWTLPETLPAEKRNPEPLRTALAGYLVLARNPRLLGYAGSGGFFYAGIFAYIAGTPFAYISYYHVLPAVYGLLFAIAIAGIMATNLLNTRLVTHLGSDRLVQLGTAGAALAGGVAALNAWSGWGGLGGLVVPLTLYAAASGFIVANSVAGALSAFSTRAGAASALVGAMHYGMGMVSAAMVGLFADGTPGPMGWIIALGGIGSFVTATLLVRRPSQDLGRPSSILRPAGAVGWAALGRAKGAPQPGCYSGAE